jgi:bifunctional non-homologous end joining protein LigD
VYVPLGPGATHEACAEFALAVGQLLQVGDPDRVTTTRTRSERTGRVLVDWQQNARFATTVCVYSLRGRSAPTASTPLTWDEVAGGADSGDASSLRFTGSEVLERLRVHGDLFAPVLTLEQSLPTPRR